MSIDPSKSSACKGSSSYTPETWDNLKNRLGLALDTIYQTNTEGKTPVPKDLRSLHTFRCPNGVELDISALRSPSEEHEGVRILAFPYDGRLCCPISIYMATGEALGHLLPDLWHNPEYMESHLPVVKSGRPNKQWDIAPFGVEMIYSLSVRDKV